MSSISAKEAELYALLEELERDYPGDIQTSKGVRSESFAGQQKDLDALQDELDMAPAPVTTQLTPNEMSSAKNRRHSHVDELEAIMADLGDPPSAEPEKPRRQTQEKPHLSASEQQLEALMSDLMTTAMDNAPPPGEAPIDDDPLISESTFSMPPPTRLNSVPEPSEESMDEGDFVIGRRESEPEQYEEEITSPFDMPQQSTPAPAGEEEDIDALLNDFDKETELYRSSLQSARASAASQSGGRNPPPAVTPTNTPSKPLSRGSVSSNRPKSRPTSHVPQNSMGSPFSYPSQPTRTSQKPYRISQPPTRASQAPSQAQEPTRVSQSPNRMSQQPKRASQEPSYEPPSQQQQPNRASQPPANNRQSYQRQRISVVADVQNKVYKPIAEAFSYSFNFMGPQTTQLGCAAVFKLGAKESSGNHLQVDLNNVQGIAHGPCEERAEIKNGINGAANIEFVFKTQGEYSVHVHYNNQPLFSQKLKAFEMGGGNRGGGSPTVTNFKVEGMGLTYAKTSQTTNFLMLVNDGGGNPKDIEVKDVRVRMEGNDNFFARVSHSGQTGRYLAEYTPTIPGKYLVFISYKGQNIINNIELVVT